MTKLRAACLVAIAMGTTAFAGDKAINDGNKLAIRVEKRVHELLPTREDRRIDEIGWAKNIRDAERLAKENQRPVFLFTHDGRIATGRC